MSSVSVGQRYLTRRQLAEFLTEHGFPISKSTLDKLAMQRAARVRPMSVFGGVALYDPDKALAWAKKRFRTNWRAIA